MDGDKVWRWIVRGAGLGGIYYGAILNPELPESYLLLFAAMIGLPEFIRTRDDAHKTAEDLKDVARKLASEENGA